MPIQFLDLIHWAKLKVLGQEMDKDTEHGFNEHLLVLAKFRDRSVSSASSGRIVTSHLVMPGG